ncbi:MAG: RagB/SusD family nutrient uptake outer membrane protein [Odoribacter sp.]|nr:RagB/SusD family nutrient uptake outer membrane protein [Odoribacter sp.]
MKMYIQRLIWTGCLAAMLSGCSKWLDVQPYDQISEEALSNTEEGFQKQLNGIYIELNDEALYGKTLTVEMVEIMGGAYEIGDDALVWSNYPDLKNYNYGTIYWRDRLDKTWDKAYALILNCNKLLANIEGKQELFTDDNYNIIRGEALALRAMLHFDMLRLFGPVYSTNSEMVSIPYYTAETHSPESLLAASKVIDNILTDLKEALILLNNDPVRTLGTRMYSPEDGSSNFLYYRSLRLNYYAVTGLAARVSLYAGQKTEARGYARTVIQAVDNGIFPFVDRYSVGSVASDPDRIFSTEVLFALSNNNRGQLFRDFFSPSRYPNMVFRMETGLLENFIFGGRNGGDIDDFRCQANWISSGSTRYFYKYSDMEETGRIENTMIPLLRTGEMYLILAESQSDNLSGGTAYVNLLRSKRNVANIETLTPEGLQYEYIRELYGEGQLFFMYKRMNTRILRSATEADNVPPSNAVFVVPLPETETDNR